MHIESKIVHGGQHPDRETGALSPPIYQTSTFVFKDADHGARLFKKEEKGYIYTRLSNPTNDLLAKKVANLESADAGVVFASGMAAIFNAIASLAKSGDHIISDDTIYGGTNALFKSVLPRMGIEVTMIDTTKHENIVNSIRPNTKMIFIETPANPTLKIIDIQAVSSIAHEQKIPVCVDNTFATPYLQRPLEMGADIVLHSATKYFGGHGDIIGGIVVGSHAFIDKLWEIAKEIGASISPFNAWLILRGIKTLAVRMDRHCDSALKIAEYLSGHKKIEHVYYPGLRSNPGYELAKKQMFKPRGMIGLEVRSGREAGKKMMNNVKLCTLAVSLGDVDTLIEHPASMTHGSYSEEELLA